MEKDIALCFMVVEDENENRLCPCVPALNSEIQKKMEVVTVEFIVQKEKAHELLLNIDTKEAIATHFRGLTKKECEDLLSNDEINSIELEALLEARDEGAVNFV